MERKGKRPKKRTAFVPSVVFTTAIAGVVPACVVGCGSSGSGGTLPSVAGCGFTNPGNCPTVAAVGYCAFCDGGDAATEAQADVATDAPEAGDAGGDAPGDAIQDMTMGVADVGFRGD